jgi:PAS domain S-box-containing protein
MSLDQFLKKSGELAILVVTDCEATASELHRRFAALKIPFWLHRASSETQFEQSLSFPTDLIFCACDLANFSASRALQLLKTKGLDLPLVVLSRELSDQAVEELLAGGAHDYFDTESVDRLRVVVNRALRESDERRKKDAAQQKLRESEERFRQLAEHMNEVFWLTDATGEQILYVSPSYETVWGRTCGSLYERPLDWIEAVHPEDRKMVQRQFLDLVSGQYDVVYRIVRPDGRIRWIHDRASKVFDEHGLASPGWNCRRHHRTPRA